MRNIRCLKRVKVEQKEKVHILGFRVYSRRLNLSKLSTFSAQLNRTEKSVSIKKTLAISVCIFWSLKLSMEYDIRSMSTLIFFVSEGLR